MQELENNSLQSSCLKVIVDEFERYFSAFCNSDDAALKRRFEFLQRKYSYQMATFLYEKNQMKAEYVDFFVNKHLKVLDFDWLKDCTWETIVAKFQEVGSDLQKVVFNEDYDMPLQELMCYLPNLEAMIFHEFCNDEILKNVGKFCQNILTIDVTNSESVTNEGLTHLCMGKNGENPCHKLKNIYVSYCNVTDEGMAFFLKHRQSIEVIGYNYVVDVLYSIHKKDLPFLDKLKPYNLQILDMLHCSQMPHYDDLLKVCCSLCPNLKTLSCPIFKQEQISFLCELTALESLRLENNSNSEIHINELLESNGKKLHTLNVSRISLSVSTLPNFCPVLRYLNLSQVNFKIETECSLVFPCLEICTFDSIVYNEVSINSMCLLMKKSPKLDYLAFKHCDLFPNEMKVGFLKCCEEKPIKNLKFNDITLEMAFIQDILLNCHSLSLMDLDNCRLSNDDEFELEKIAELLPNTPKIYFGDASLDESDDSFNNDFEDYDEYGFSGSSYDDDDYDHDDDDIDYVFENHDDDYYGCFFD